MYKFDSVASVQIHRSYFSKEENHKYDFENGEKYLPEIGVLLHMFLRFCQLRSNFYIHDINVWVHGYFLVTVRLRILGTFKCFQMFARTTYKTISNDVRVQETIKQKLPGQFRWTFVNKKK